MFDRSKEKKKNVKRRMEYTTLLCELRVHAVRRGRNLKSNYVAIWLERSAQKSKILTTNTRTNYNFENNSNETHKIQIAIIQYYLHMRQVNKRSSERAGWLAGVHVCVCMFWPPNCLCLPVPACLPRIPSSFEMNDETHSDFFHFSLFLSSRNNKYLPSTIYS